MLNLNRVEVVGNLTRDPELRYTPNNQAVASFAIATNRRYRDQGGNWVDSPPEYHEVVVWGQVAENCQKVLHKGDRVYVSGRLQTRSWEAQDGSKRYKTEMVADYIIGPDLVNKFSGSGNNDGNFDQEGSNFAPASSGSKAKAKPAKSTPSEEEINIDDIPF